MELKERMNHSAHVLRKFLDKDYAVATDQLMNLVAALENTEFYETSVEFMFLPGIVEHYGISDLENSVKAMTKITQFTSCEFAVRPFYLKYPEEMILQTRKWSKHKHFKVRRLASEGCRPMLPWAMALPFLKKDPGPILPILDQLKDDPEEFVRRSVANNLNDISKNQPELVLDMADKWIGANENRNKLIKHGLRTLLKQGNSRALSFFGYGNVKYIKLTQFEISTPVVKVGERLKFAFDFRNNSSNSMLVRLEYAIHYLKANGTHSKKVFKISEKEIEGLSENNIEREQSFKPITTRVFHKGEHKVSIIINGLEFEPKSFVLK